MELGQSSVRSLVQHLLRGPEFTSYTRWGCGVQRSELARSAVRMFDAEWAGRGEQRLPSQDHGLSDRQERVAREVLLSLAEPLILVADITADLLGHVAELCREAGVAASMDQLSGRCTTAATAHVRRHERAPTIHELREAASHIMARVSARAPRSWSAEPFGSHFASSYDAQWRRHGELNLTAYPPSLLLLGHDARPPLVRHGTRETDACGTDRSVYSRYTSYRPPGRGERVPFRSRSARCIQPVTQRDTQRDVATEEMQRTCLPYGLEQQIHRKVLRGTHHGLALDGHGAGPVGEDLSGRCVPMQHAAEEDIAETVRRILHERTPRRRQAAETLAPDGQLEYGQGYEDARAPVLLAGQLDRVHRVVMRRLWKALHGLEMYVEEHICSCSLKAVVCVAVDRAVPSVRTRFDDDGCGEPRLSTASDDPLDAATREAAVLVEAQNKTCELLMRHPEVSRALLTLRPGWESTYRDLVAKDPQSHLAPDEFAQWCRDVVPLARNLDQEAM